MALPGINNFMSQAYSKINNKQTTEKNKQSEKTNYAQRDNTRKKDVSETDSKYTKSDYSNYNKNEKVDSLGGTNQAIELSDKAKEYLQELRKKYKDMDIMVADYSTDEDAQKYLSRGKGKINVLINVETLEKMANDESVRSQYESILDSSGQTLNNMKEELGEDAKYVKSIGVSFDDQGNAKYFSIIDESLAKRYPDTKKDKVKNQEDDKKNHKPNSNKEKLDSYQKPKNSGKMIQGDDVESLMKNIREAIEEARKNSYAYGRNSIDMSV